MTTDDVTLTEAEREALERSALASLVSVSRLPKWMQAPALGRDMRPLAALVATYVTHAVARILADRLAQVTARAERAEAQVERVRAVVRDWAAATCIADGAPCSFHRQSPEHASDVLAALAETETGHQTAHSAPDAAKEESNDA